MKRLPSTQRLSTTLTKRFGIALRTDSGEGEEGPYVEIRPADLHDNEGFLVRTILGWRHVRSEFVLGRFAGELLRRMASASSEQKAGFASLVAFVKSNGGKVNMIVNGVAVDAAQPSEWPVTWRSLDLQIEKTPMMIDHDDLANVDQVITIWAGALLGMAVSLIPTESVETEDQFELRGFPEGAVDRIEVNRYERNRVNRALCIAMHGAYCAVCDLDFGAVYGELGEGFIVVHHRTPVSKLGPGYIINPATDLVPVCPNCHAMLHRQDPPLSVDELRKHLRPRGANSGP